MSRTDEMSCVLPSSVLQFNGRNLGLKEVPIRLPVQPRPVGIVTPRKRTACPVARLFIDALRASADARLKAARETAHG